MNHLHLTYEQVMNTPLCHLSLLISESTPRYKKEKSKEVELDTYWGKVKAKKQFII